MQVRLNLSNSNQFKNNNLNANKNNSPAFTSKVQFLEGATKGTEDFLSIFQNFTKHQSENCINGFKDALESLTNKIDGTINFAKTKHPLEVSEMGLSYVTKEGKELSLEKLYDNEMPIIFDLGNYKNPYEESLNKSINILSKTLKENGYADHENPFLQLQKELQKEQT